MDTDKLLVVQPRFTRGNGTWSIGPAFGDNSHFANAIADSGTLYLSHNTWFSMFIWRLTPYGTLNIILNWPNMLIDRADPWSGVRAILALMSEMDLNQVTYSVRIEDEWFDLKTAKVV